MSDKDYLEIKKFLRVRSTMRMIDQEDIVSVQIGGADEARLTSSGLRAVLCDLDTARAECDAALAEVYAMRAVVGDARRLVDHWHAGLGMIGPVTSLRSDLDALDALRTRKGGG